MLKNVVKKSSESDEIIQALKQCGLRGDVAKGYFKNPVYSLERLIRYVWLFRYKKSLGVVKNDFAYMNDILKNKYVEPEAFWDWYKGQMANPRKNDFPILYKVL